MTQPLFACSPRNHPSQQEKKKDKTNRCACLRHPLIPHDPDNHLAILLPLRRDRLPNPLRDLLRRDLPPPLLRREILRVDGEERVALERGLLCILFFFFFFFFFFRCCRCRCRGTLPSSDFGHHDPQSLTMRRRSMMLLMMQRSSINLRPPDHKHLPQLPPLTIKVPTERLQRVLQAPGDDGVRDRLLLRHLRHLLQDLLSVRRRFKPLLLPLRLQLRHHRAAHDPRRVAAHDHVDPPPERPQGSRQRVVRPAAHDDRVRASGEGRTRRHPREEAHVRFDPRPGERAGVADAEAGFGRRWAGADGGCRDDEGEGGCVWCWWWHCPCCYGFVDRGVIIVVVFVWGNGHCSVFVDVGKQVNQCLGQE
ncbi:hypothetical protein VTN02DRAFT_5767 [Thermoascus thermophilus]